MIISIWLFIIISIILRKAENREEWRKLVLKSTMVSPPVSQTTG